YAGSIDYLAQQDSEYFAHPSMTGKIGTSGAFYNPAGTAFMEDGSYFKYNVQSIMKDYTMNTDKGIISGGQNGIHNSDYPSVLVPSFQFVKKEGGRSYFVHAGVAAGGGTVKYHNGISAFEAIGEEINKKFSALGGGAEYLGGSTVEGSSFYYNLNLGMAQKLNEKFSVGGGVRLIYATRELKGTGNFKLDAGKLGESLGKKEHNITVDLDAKREAYGIGGFIGFDYKPNDRLNIGFKYESEVKLDFEAIGNEINNNFATYDGGAKYLGGSTVEGSSFYYNLNLGMAQKLNEKFSVGGGVRLIYATRELDGSGKFEIKGKGLTIPIDVTIDAKREAYGVGGFIGFDYKPNDRLNIGFKYESEVKLDFEAKNGKNGLKTTSNNPVGNIFAGQINGTLEKNPVVKEWLVDGHRNLPAMMSLGISYDVTDRFTLLTSGNYYFIRQANEDHAYDNYTNGYEASIGFDYKLNEKYTLMGGYQYTNTGANEGTYKDTDYALDAHMYSIGLSYSPNETRKYTIAYSFVDYISGTSSQTKTTFEKKVNAIGASVEFKL
ncbi:OmpP1/FadL family transporter, partial [Fusobacterium sp.]|uniref:OmpP1/FadL family transporter n=1 Tax=Fusobacterium sp. TaxID=68766 RepID=UPI0026380E5B